MYKILKKISDWLSVGNSFALANIFAMSMAGNPVGLWIAIITGIFSWRTSAYALRNGEGATNRFYKLENAACAYISKITQGVNADLNHLPLRVNAYGIGLAAFITFFTALKHGGMDTALLPVLAGTAFSIGNYLGSDPKITSIQMGKTPASGLTRTITNAAVYFGIGYINLGLMAGGGFALILAPLSDIPALMTTTLSITVTLVSTFGLLTHRLKNPAPFMLVAHATSLNMLSAILTMNPLALFNNFFACHGEVRLGVLLNEDKAQKMPASPNPWKKLNFYANWPIRKFKL